QATSLLQIGVKRPGIDFPDIPASWLAHRPAGKETPVAGVEYELFETPGISALGEIPETGAVARGTVTRFDIGPAQGKQEVAMRFTGFLTIPVSGEYAFRLT